MRNLSNALNTFKSLANLTAMCFFATILLISPTHATNWLPVEDASFLNAANEFWIRVSILTFNKYRSLPLQNCSELIAQNMKEDGLHPVILKHYTDKSLQYIGQDLFGADAMWSKFHDVNSGLQSEMIMSGMNIELPLSRFRVDKNTVEIFEKISKHISYEKFNETFTYSTLIAKEHIPGAKDSTILNKWETILARNLSSISLKCKQ